PSSGIEGPQMRRTVPGPLELRFRRRLALLAAAAATVGAVAAGQATPAAAAPSLDDQIESYQLAILSAINCEELALQPQLSDDLARGWVHCSRHSLQDALDLLAAGVAGAITGPGIHGANIHINEAGVTQIRLKEAIRADQRAVGTTPLDK